MPVSGTMKVASAALVLTSTLLTAVPQAEARPGYYSGRHYYAGPVYRHHRGNAGAAAAAGVIGGLALGALAAGAANRGGYYESYPAYGYGDCYVTRQRVYDGWGYPRWRRVQVCN